MRPILILSDKSQETVNLLREGLAGCEEVIPLWQSPDQLLMMEGLDAVYMSVMAAERWGARPIPHSAQILQTAPSDAERGYPSYVIAGGLFEREDSRAPGFQLRTILRAVLSGVNSFNAVNDEPISKIGFWANDLCFPPLSPLEVGAIIKSVYEECYPISTS